jgi:hypothetical protein
MEWTLSFFCAGRKNGGTYSKLFDSVMATSSRQPKNGKAERNLNLYVEREFSFYRFGGDPQTQRRLQKELRRNCWSYSLLALDKCCAASIVLVASLDGSCRRCVGLLVEMLDRQQFEVRGSDDYRRRRNKMRRGQYHLHHITSQGWNSILAARS